MVGKHGHIPESELPFAEILLGDFVSAAPLDGPNVRHGLRRLIPADSEAAFVAGT